MAWHPTKIYFGVRSLPPPHYLSPASLLYIKPLLPSNCEDVSIIAFLNLPPSYPLVGNLLKRRAVPAPQEYSKMPHLHERTSYDSTASYDSASSSGSDDEKDLLPPYGLVFYNRKSENKPLPPLPSQSQRRVRFALEKPLPPL